MNKKELEFRKLLEVLDKDFSEYMLEQDFKLLELDGITKINNFSFRKDYWSKNVEDVTINPNANVGNTGDKKSFTNLVSEMVSPINKLSSLYLLRKYGNRINGNGDNLVKGILNGELYYQNLTLLDSPYCVGLSTYPLLIDGLQFGYLTSNPPRRPTSFINQAIRWVQIASNHFAGATALTDFFVNYSWFTSQLESYSDKEREQDLQNFIHGVSDPVRVGSQSPFTNLSLQSPATLKSTLSNYMWGKDTKIEDLLDETMKNQRIYAKFMARGQLDLNREPLGLPYRFPITTLVADPSFEHDYPEVWNEIIQDNSNLCYLNIFNNWKTDLSVLSTCCRLNMDIKMLKVNINNTFGSFLQVGSHGVVSINLCRIAYESKGNIDDFIGILEKRCQMARELLTIHRIEILTKRRLKFHYFFARGYLNLHKNFFSTLGFIGLPNAIEIMGTKVTEPDGLNMAKNILIVMKNLAEKYSQEDNFMYNVEEVPGETASGILAQKDKILVKGSYDFYDTQFAPLSYDISLPKRIEIEGELQEFCTGGSISHLNLNGRPNPESLKKFTEDILQKSKLRQFAFNAGFTTCESGHTSMGVFQKCPNCGSMELSWLTRIVGYLVPTNQWNKMKQLEFTKRVWNKLD